MRKILTFVLSLGFFILLPNALADDADNLSINTPTHSRQIQTTPTDHLLLTLRADNIQVQAKWQVTNASDAFMIDDGKLFLTMTTIAPGVHMATVMVEDRFDLLNTVYTNLTAQATLMVEVGIPILADAPLLLAVVSVTTTLHTFSADNGENPYTYILVDDPDYFAIAVDDDSATLIYDGGGDAHKQYTLTIAVSDVNKITTKAVATVSIASPLVLSLPHTLTVTAGFAGAVYSYTANGGAGDKTYALVGGAGYFSLADTVLLISDQALAALYTLGIVVSDEVGTITATMLIEVIPGPIILDGVANILTVQLYANSGSPFIAFRFLSYGGLGAHTYTVLSTSHYFLVRQADYFSAFLSRPSGVVEAANDIAEGTYHITLHVEDEAATQITAMITIIVLHRPMIKSLSAGTDGITVIWQTVSQTDSYLLYRYTESDNTTRVDSIYGVAVTTYTNPRETLLATLTTNSYVDTTATDNTLYFYRLAITRGTITYSSPIAAAFGLGESSPQLLDFTETYYSSPEIEAQMRVLAAEYPRYATFTVIGQSIEGRNIAALKITDHDVGGDKAIAVFLGGYHAREWIAYNVPHMIGEYLITAAAAGERKTLTATGINYEVSPAILLTNAEVWVVPAVNPDGREYSKIDRWWRKNMRDNGDGTFGVDLNRNHSYQWGELNNDGGSSNASNTFDYRGTHANSEPETQAVCRLMYSFQPRDPTMLLSYHNFGQLLLHPWGWGVDGLTPGYKNLITQNPAEYEYMNSIGVTMSILIKQVDGRSYEAAESGAGLYAANGDVTDWAYVLFNTPSYTIELRPFYYPYFFLPEDEIWPTFAENLPAALYSIDRAIVNKDREQVDYSTFDGFNFDPTECNPK